jgi:hypothetical protein
VPVSRCRAERDETVTHARRGYVSPRDARERRARDAVGGTTRPGPSRGFGGVPKLPPAVRTRRPIRLIRVSERMSGLEAS